MVVTGAETQLDQRARIRHGLRLPTLIRLITPERSLGRVVPSSRGFPVHVVLSNQSFLNLLSALGFNCLLAGLFRALAACLVARPLFVGRRFRTRRANGFCRLVRRRGRTCHTARREAEQAAQDRNQPFSNWEENSHPDSK